MSEHGPDVSELTNDLLEQARTGMKGEQDVVPDEKADTPPN